MAKERKILTWLLAISLLFSCVLVSPLPARADSAQGEWVLVSTEDSIPEDYYSYDSDSGTDWFYEAESSTIFQYTHSDFTVDWYSTYIDEEESLRNEGTVHTSFGVLPERIKPGETLSLDIDIQSSCSVDEMPEFGVTSAKAEVTCSRYLFTGEDGPTREVWYSIPLYPDVSYSRVETLKFSLPEPSETVLDLSGTDVIYFDFALSIPYTGEIATTYTYEWEPAGEEAPKSAQTIALKGLVLSSEAQPMRWMQLEAQVYYGDDEYSGSRAPDLVVEGTTDHEGRYLLNIPLEEDGTGPVGILLIGTLKCVYPFDGGHDAFYFVDTQDSFSKDNDRVSVSTWIAVDPDDYPWADSDTPLSVYRLLAFYNLGLDAWSFDAGLDSLEPDPVYYFSADAKHPERLENYSTLYTAAFDAWFFGAAVLKEAESMIKKVLRIELRWPVTPELNSSHYDPGEHCIRLEETDSLRDDNSRFTILHEFGHSFDYATNGNYRTAASYGVDDTNHGGYLNSSTSDSYLEGFATFFAGTVQLFSGYENPNILSWIRLENPSLYTAWGQNGANEELAIATLLYNAHFMIRDIEKYWEVLDPDRANFYEYYIAIEARVTNAQEFRENAISGGLYLMPFGNGEHDLGEPLLNEPDGIRFADLMFDVGENGYIDPEKPLQEYDEDDLVVGQSCDALRERKTIQEPLSGYLYLSGEEVEYLLVDVVPDKEQSSRMLFAVDEGKVLIGLPDKPMTGKVAVSVPGGGTLYEGDLAELQQRQIENTGQAIPLAEAHISTSDLAPAGTEATATYGDVGASGVLAIPEVSQDELVRLADGYDGDAELDEVTAALVARKDGGGGNSLSASKPQSSVLLFIALGLGVLAAVALLLYFISRKRKPPVGDRGTRGAANYQTAPRLCPNCGAPMSERAVFCRACGKAAPQPQLQPELAAFCAACGTSLTPDMDFCMNCGTRRTVQQAYTAGADAMAAQIQPAETAKTQAQGKAARIWLIAAIALAVGAALCVGAYFLLSAIKSLPEQKTPTTPTKSITLGGSAQKTAPPSTPAPTAETVNNKLITVDMAYDSGEGIYSGEVNAEGVPHGQGSFIMQKSDNNLDWGYEGQWENGQISGYGMKTEGSYVSTGTFQSGLLNGEGDITYNDVLRYTGMWSEGSLHGQGTLYTKAGTFIFEGNFENDMLVESDADKERRSEAFKPTCVAMDDLLYDRCMNEDNTFGSPVHVWGHPLGLSEQAASGTVILGHFGSDSYPVCLLYRYTVGEPKMTGGNLIDAWGVVTGLFEYTDVDGNPAVCPQIEVICWEYIPEGP